MSNTPTLHKIDAARTIDQVVHFLQARQVVLTVAESCTAGAVCSLIADVSGCGSVLYSGYVVYDERAKQECLDVSATTIAQFGLTSEEVAREMALGALKRHRAHEGGPNFSIAITGTAESQDEQNGVVCFAYATFVNGEISVLSETIKFTAPRNEVRKQAAHHAILSLPRYYEKLTA